MIVASKVLKLIGKSQQKGGCLLPHKQQAKVGVVENITEIKKSIQSYVSFNV